MRGPILSALAAVSSIFLLDGVAASNLPLVTVRNGTYQGVSLPQYHQEVFFGMKYGRAARFAAPLHVDESWTGVRKATEYGPSCPSIDPLQAPFKQSEDCLSVNVARPIGTKKGDKLPVALWIYGGAYQYGTTADPTYNTTFLVDVSVEAGKPIIIVSANYRVGGFGYLSSAEVYGDRAANAGLKDQRLAMHWVQENIAAFGGDPSRVTIWGHSAGGFAVSAHLLAYNGRDDKLFHQAVIESGGPIAQYNPASIADYQAGYDNITAAVGCSTALDTLNCIRKAPYEAVLAAFNTWGNSWYPVVDGDFVASWPDKQLHDGAFVRVPVMQGTCTDEGTDFGSWDNSTTAAVIASSDFASNMYPSTLARLEELYPNIPALGSPYEYPNQNDFSYGLQYKRISALLGDMFYIMPRRYFSESMAKWGVKTYTYRWNTQARLSPDIIGVTHQSELGYVMYNWLNGPGQPYAGAKFTKSDFALGKLTARMWVSFFATGSPNNHGYSSIPAPTWPTYKLNEPKNFVFNRDVPSVIEPDTFRKAGISYFKKNVKQIFRR